MFGFIIEPKHIIHEGRGKKEVTHHFATNFTNEHELLVKIREIRGKIG